MTVNGRPCSLTTGPPCFDPCRVLPGSLKTTGHGAARTVINAPAHSRLLHAATRQSGSSTLHARRDPACTLFLTFWWTRRRWVLDKRLPSCCQRRTGQTAAQSSSPLVEITTFSGQRSRQSPDLAVQERRVREADSSIGSLRRMQQDLPTRPGALQQHRADLFCTALRRRPLAAARELAPRLRRRRLRNRTDRQRAAALSRYGDCYDHA